MTVLLSSELPCRLCSKETQRDFHSVTMYTFIYLSFLYLAVYSLIHLRQYLYSFHRVFLSELVVVTSLAGMKRLDAMDMTKHHFFSV
jgi:hypothetical protein